MIHHLKIDKQSLLTKLHKNEIIYIYTYFKVPSPSITKKLICKEKVSQYSFNTNLIYKIKNH